MIEIRGDRGKLLGLTLIGILMTTLGVALGFRWFSGIEPWDFIQLVGLFGAVFFGFATIGSIYRLYRANDIRLKLSADGIWEQRYGNQVLPWSEIRELSVTAVRRQPFVMLKIDRETENRLLQRPWSRVSMWLNRTMDFDGLPLSAAGLAISNDELIKLLRGFWAASWEPQNRQ